MRILELKDCKQKDIYNMIYSIEKLGFNTIQINNDLEDLKVLARRLDNTNIRVILELDKSHYFNINKILDLNIHTLKVNNISFYKHLLKILYKSKIRLLTNKDYINVLNGFNNTDKIGYIANNDTYKDLNKDELIKYKQYLNDLYNLLTNSYDDTLYSPITSNGKIDYNFLEDEKIEKANKILVR